MSAEKKAIAARCMRDSRPPLSVVIITLNEERRVRACLGSVRGLADDIVVVDALSRDRTVEICRASGARVFSRGWTGFSDQKNFGNAQARHDWILSLDADERVSPELAVELQRELARGPTCDAYAIRFRNHFGAHRVRFGAWNPEWHVRLFDRRKCNWNTDAVHEGLRGLEDIRCGQLAGPIEHHTVASAPELAAKSRRYGRLFARKLRRLGRTPGWTKVWLNPMWRFVRDYFLRLGVCDGWPGLVIALEAAHYTHLKYCWARRGARAVRQREWFAASAAAAMFAVLLGTTPRILRQSESSDVTRTEPVLVQNSNTYDGDPLNVMPDDEDEDVLT